MTPPVFFSLTFSFVPAAKLYFHQECFEGNAGTDYTKTIEDGRYDKCLMCLENNRVPDPSVKGKQWLCGDCKKILPKCMVCKKQMTLKYSGKSQSIFYSCSDYPTCKYTKNVI